MTRLPLPRAAALVAAPMIAIILPASALAKGPGGPPDKDGWNVRLGAATLYAPDYQGSDDYEVRVVPDLEVTYSDWLFLNREGLGVNLLRGGPLVAGIAVLPEGGRDQDENSALAGLGDIDTTAEIKAFANYTVGSFTFGAKLRQDLLGEGHDGLVAEVSATYAWFPARGTMIFAGPSLSWADDDYMGSYFGIDGAQAAATAYDVYDAGSGFKDVGFSVVAITEIGNGFALTAIAGYERLLGDAADSPIVDGRGDRDQFISGLGLSYRF